ncbi:prolyl 4-hydroxylase subunit alpha-1 [Biomphalaria glabrata]
MHSCTLQKVLHDLEYTLISLEWLEQLYKRLMNLGVTQRDELPFAVTDVLNLMASENYQLNNFEKAKTFTEKILDLDPDNALAKNNLIFFQQKLQSLKDSDDKVQNKKSSSRQLSGSERLCARRSTKKLLRKYCKLLRYGFLFYKVEIIRKKPYIVIFHDVIRNETITGLKTFAHETLTDNAWVLGERYKAPTFNVEVKTEMLLRNRARRHVKRLIRYLDSLMLADDRKPILIDNLQLMNIGLEGTDIIRHRHELRLHSMFVDGKMTSVGGYFVFLNQVKTGGEVIFPQLGIKIHPTVGSVLFYEITKSTYHSFCPVVGSTLWVALRPVHESKDFCVDEDEWL